MCLWAGGGFCIAAEFLRAEEGRGVKHAGADCGRIDVGLRRGLALNDGRYFWGPVIELSKCRAGPGVEAA